LNASRLLPSSRETERKNNMIHIDLLSETDQLVYVVYQCDDQWDRFEEYNAAATDPEDLDFV
jgi:hypothetical protein